MGDALEDDFNLDDVPVPPTAQAQAPAKRKLSAAGAAPPATPAAKGKNVSVGLGWGGLCVERVMCALVDAGVTEGNKLRGAALATAARAADPPPTTHRTPTHNHQSAQKVARRL